VLPQVALQMIARELRQPLSTTSRSRTTSAWCRRARTARGSSVAAAIGGTVQLDSHLGLQMADELLAPEQIDLEQ
jgi:hypothetical protein